MRIKDPRPLQVKIRVTARKGMIKNEEDLIAIVQGIIESRVVPAGVTVHWIDWKKGTGGRANEGRIEANIADALEDFWFAIIHEDAELALKKVGKMETESGEGGEGV